MALRTAAQDAAPTLAERAIALYEAAGEHGAAARVLDHRSRIDRLRAGSTRRLERLQRAYDVLRDEPPDATSPC